jgi:hypothetical protein
MAKRYIIQKREVEERHGRKHLMGPYRTLYSDIKPPFDLSDKEKIEANLLRRYGEGRYQVKSVGKEEGEEKSTITVHFTGEVERYRPRAKIWTREERVAYLRSKWRRPKEKWFVLVAFFILFLISAWAFAFTLGAAWDPTLIIVAIVIIFIVFMAAAFFIDMMLFETE